VFRVSTSASRNPGYQPPAVTVATALPKRGADSAVLIGGDCASVGAAELRAAFDARGFATSRRGVPGQMAFEKYW